jgi:predicted metal-dependent hydrolase
VSQKGAKISARIDPFGGGGLAAHYLGYFERFNKQLFFEAHEVLEELWLPQRDGPNGPFYKGLIQLAGAFVHVQKKRLGPAAALLRLAQVNLGKYPARYEGLEVFEVQQQISGWLTRVEQGLQELDGQVKLKPPRQFVLAGNMCHNIVI